MKKPQLVKDMRRRMRYWSVRIQAATLLFVTTYLGLPEDQQIKLLASIGIDPALLVLVAVAASAVAQFIKQASLDDEPESAQSISNQP